MWALIAKHPGAVIGAICLHGLIGALFFFSFDWSEQPEAEAGIPISLVTSDSLQPQSNNVAEEESKKELVENRQSDEKLLKEKLEAGRTSTKN